MRVFVTGASGFVGSHLVTELLNTGHEVAILAFPDDPLDRLMSVQDHIQLIRGDLGLRDTFEGALKNFHPECSVHLAWYVEPGKYLNSPLNVSYLESGLRLFEVLIRIGCKQLVGIGTCAEYDTDYGFLRENSPTKPASLYAASKLCLNILGHQLAKNANVRFAWARLFYFYGPAEDPRRVVPALIKSLLRNETFRASSGEQIRDYLHVKDVASALSHIVAKQLSGIYNISSGQPLSVRQLMETIGSMMGKSSLIQLGAQPSRQWEPKFICGDNQKLCDTGWQPQIILTEGIRDTIQWWTYPNGC